MSDDVVSEIQKIIVPLESEMLKLGQELISCAESSDIEKCFAKYNQFLVKKSIQLAYSYFIQTKL